LKGVWGFLQRVTMVLVSSLHLLSHCGWSLGKKNSWTYGTLAHFPSILQNISNWIISAPSFCPSFLISQRILWQDLDAVKLASLLLKTFWIKIFPILW
jgi:hypothetical protein